MDDGIRAHMTISEHGCMHWLNNSLWLILNCVSLLSGKRGFLHFLLFVQRYGYLKDDSIINDEISEPVIRMLFLLLHLLLLLLCSASVNVWINGVLHNWFVNFLYLFRRGREGRCHLVRAFIYWFATVYLSTYISVFVYLINISEGSSHSTSSHFDLFKEMARTLDKRVATGVACVWISNMLGEKPFQNCE